MPVLFRQDNRCGYYRSCEAPTASFITSRFDVVLGVRGFQSRHSANLRFKCIQDKEEINSFETVKNIKAYC
jgi:hypothetical protein